MTEQTNDGQPAFEPTPLSALDGPAQDTPTQAVPEAAVVPPAVEEPAPADPPHVSPAELAGAEPPVTPDLPVAEVPVVEAAPEPQYDPQVFAQGVTAALQQMGIQPPQHQAPQQERPDWNYDPEQAYAYERAQDVMRETDMRINMSVEMARLSIPDYEQVMGPNNTYWAAYQKSNPDAYSKVASAAFPAKVAYDMLKQEQLVQTINGAGGLDAIRQQAVDAYKASLDQSQQPSQPATPIVPQQGQAQPPAPAQTPTPVANQNAPAFQSPPIPTMMGDDRSASPGTGSVEWKGPTPLSVIDASIQSRKRTG